MSIKRWSVDCLLIIWTIVLSYNGIQNVVMSEQGLQLELLGEKKILLNAITDGVKTIDWITHNSTAIEKLVANNGALLIRGLKIHSSKQFSHILEKLFEGSLLNYNYRSTPRTEFKGNIYTATEYPASEIIPQHNENSYSNRWAMRLGLLCMMPPESGGETPLADSRKIYQNIPSEIRDEFERKGVLYVRNYLDIDLPWSEVFQTNDKKEVERYCDNNKIDFEWVDGNTLRTKQSNPAVAVHPVTNEKVWFNQAHLFHISSLESKVKDNLLSLYGENQLPRNTYFADGTSIDEEILEVIRDVYKQYTFSFPWEKNDLVLLDNMLFTHGRNPYKGARKILIGMAREHHH